jgi:flagellar hook-basal body complex protein FliE
MIDGVTALSATKSAAGSFVAGAVAGAGSGGATSGDFGQVLNQVVGDAIGTLQTGEAMAIRDKAVSAYQEISRMTI